MLESISQVTVLAAEGIPYDSPLARLVTPLGVLAFIGSIYLLLRSNIGTRRGYYVLGSSLFGFLLIMSLFWTFGAPGTPQAVGPTHLPSQPSDYYEPRWTPFAIDSLVAERPAYQFVREYPEGFGPVPDGFAGEAAAGADDTTGFFSSEAGGDAIGDDWPIEEILYAEAPNGNPVLAVTVQPVDAEGNPVPEQDPETYFAFFIEANPLVPGFVFIGVSLLLFLLHLALLGADERRERREAEAVGAVAAEEHPREPVRA